MKRPRMPLALHWSLIPFLAIAVGFAWAASRPHAAALDPNAERLQQMNSNEMLSLKRKLRRFEKLPPERQAELRSFYQRLSAHPRQEALKATLSRYYEWLSSLDSRRQAELTDTIDRHQRIAKIRQLRSEQARAFSFLPQTDFEKFDQWLVQLASDKKAAVLEAFQSIPRSARRDLELNENSPPDRIARYVIRVPGYQARIVSDQDIEALKRQLSESTAQLLDDPNIARNIIIHFVRNPYVSPEELQRFYVHDLPARLRDELDKLPHDQMMAQVRRIHQLKQIGFPPEQWGRRVPSRQGNN